MRNRVAFLCLVSVLIAACGGGGGGGGDDGTATPPPAPPAPPAPPSPPAQAPFALTEANAVEAAAYALGPLELMFQGASSIVFGASALRSSGQLTLRCSINSSVTGRIGYTDRDASGTLTVGDVVDMELPDCSGLRRDFSLTLTRFGTTPAEPIEGRVEMDFYVDPPGMQVVGTFDVSLGPGIGPNETISRITNAVATVTKINTTQTMRVATAQFVGTSTTYSYSINDGSVDSIHLGGTYSFATTTPFTGAMRRLPTAGELLLRATAGSRAKVTPPVIPGPNEETVEYAVAATSSSAFAAAQQTVWTGIIRGWQFGWRPNERPVISSLEIQPPNPLPNGYLYASHNAVDPNGDVLQTTFEWRRNGTVVGTNSPNLSVPTVRGDSISVTLTVSDGVFTTTSTASATIGNPAPTLSLTLTPPQPHSGVDLTAVPVVYEPEGEPVTTTYEWQRNGSVIASRTGAVLPASETTRGDTITVRVTASDGATSVVATASTTILDSPPVLSVLSPPTTVVHGAPVTFTATVIDGDGDPVDQLDFVLAYGPAGMTVHPDTGVVSWTAGGPMFDRTMDINWGITVTGPTAQLATGTLQVTDSGRDYPLMRSGVEIPVWPAGLSVGDLDADGDSEMLIMGRRWLFELESDGTGYRQSWAYPYALNIDTQYHYQGKNSLTTGDVDGDGRHEIFAAVGRTLTKLDGDERRAVATRQLASSEACSDLVFGDLDNDGAGEVVCLASSDYWTDTARILVLHASDLSIRHEYPQSRYGRSLAIGNVDGDSALELVTAGGYVFDGATLANQWLHGPGFGMDVGTGDVDGNGVEEIVAAADWDAIRVYRAGQASPLVILQRSDLDSLMVAEVTGDARPEIIVGDGQWGNVTIYGYNPTTTALDVIDQINSQDHGVTSIGVGNVDDDAALELVWGSGQSSSGVDKLVVAERDPTLEIEWTDTVQLNGPFKGGALAGSALAPRAPLFLSEGTNGGSSGTRLIRMPSDGGTLELSGPIGGSYGSGFSSLDVVDHDNDGDDEAYLAVGSSYGDALFHVYDFFGATSVWSSGAVQTSAAASGTNADVTGDGRPELIGITSDGVVYVHNVFQQSLVWQSARLTAGRRVLVADIDGDPDGQPEIVVATTRTVYVYAHRPQPTAYAQVATYPTDSNLIDAAVGDTDGDGEVEVVLLLAESYSSSGSTVVRLNNDLQQLGRFTLPWPAITLQIEPSAAPRKNLLLGRQVSSYAIAGTLAIVGARSGGVVFESPPLVGAPQSGSIHYVTLPGETRQRISIGTSAGMYLTR